MKPCRPPEPCDKVARVFKRYRQATSDWAKRGLARELYIELHRLDSLIGSLAKRIAAIDFPTREQAKEMADAYTRLLARGH